MNYDLSRERMALLKVLDECMTPLLCTDELNQVKTKIMGYLPASTSTGPRRLFSIMLRVYAILDDLKVDKKFIQNLCAIYRKILGGEVVEVKYSVPALPQNCATFKQDEKVADIFFIVPSQIRNLKRIRTGSDPFVCPSARQVIYWCVVCAELIIATWILFSVI